MRKYRVDSSHQWPPELSLQLLHTGLPRKVLRHLIFSHDIGVGSQVLDAGCGEGALVNFFNELGIRTSGLDDSQQNIATAFRNAPHADFSCQNAEQLTLFPEHEFNLVLVRNFSPYQKSLTSPAALRATANLISCIRPGGHLVFVECCSGNEFGKTVGHTETCYQQHLSSFGGLPRARRISDRLGGLKAWARLLTRRSRPEFLITSWQTPEKKISRFDWLRLSENSPLSVDESCCPWSQISHRQSSVGQTAA